MSKYDAQEPLSPRWCLFLVAWAVALGLLAGTAPAATYGPPVPTVEAPRTHVYPYEIGPNDTIESLDARLKADTSSAWRRFWIAQGLAGADVAITCAMLSQRNPNGSPKFREANPIYGKNASCGRVAAIRGGVSVLQYLLARRSIDRNPQAAKKGMLISIGISGIPVLWNVAQLAK
jgi:hypothetical protein